MQELTTSLHSYFLIIATSSIFANAVRSTKFIFLLSLALCQSLPSADSNASLSLRAARASLTPFLQEDDNGSGEICAKSLTRAEFQDAKDPPLTLVAGWSAGGSDRAGLGAFALCSCRQLY